MVKFDCLVLGSGPGGLYSALSCAKKGFSTAIIEKGPWGGTGFRDGCLPVKRALDAIRLYEKSKILFKEVSWEKEGFLANNEDDMGKIEGVIKNRLSREGVSLFEGEGFFTSPESYRVEGDDITADSIIIATGTSPTSPRGVVLDGLRVISHREALKLKKLPSKLTIIGGNVEGMEFASLFSSLGVSVTVVEQESEILPGNDRDMIQPLVEDLLSKGVLIKTGIKVISAIAEKPELSGVEILLEGGEKFYSEVVLVTGFRKPNIPGGLSEVGVVYTANRIPVDSMLRTNIPGIYAVGDINGIHGMAHTAIHQGMFVPDGIKGEQVPMDYENLPRAMFTLPEIAGTGVQEVDLQERGTVYRVVRFNLDETWRGFAKNVKSGFIKIIFDENNVVKGMWMTGESASEIMSSSGLYLNRTITEEDILANLFIHPTLGEGILEGVWGGMQHKEI